MSAPTAYRVVELFEETIANWAGSRYAVSVESGTAALFLSCVYKKVKEVTIPKYTYPSVPASIIHAGGTVKWSDEEWEGIYELAPYGIWDGALRFTKGMYKGGLHCLSFHIKKQLPIGRGGMILTDDQEAYTWLKRARFDGRGEMHLKDDNLTMLGWNAYMTPEQAARGLVLFQLIGKDGVRPDLNVKDQEYPDLSQYKIYG